MLFPVPCFIFISYFLPFSGGSPVSNELWSVAASTKVVGQPVVADGASVAAVTVVDLVIGFFFVEAITAVILPLLFPQRGREYCLSLRACFFFFFPGSEHTYLLLSTETHSTSGRCGDWRCASLRVCDGLPMSAKFQFCSLNFPFGQTKEARRRQNRAQTFLCRVAKVEEEAPLECKGFKRQRLLLFLVVNLVEKTVKCLHVTEYS